MKVFLINNGDKPLITKPDKPLVEMPNPKKNRKWYDLILEQLVNVAVMSGIGALSAFVANPDLAWKGALVAAGVAALIELRKYWPRKVKP